MSFKTLTSTFSSPLPPSNSPPYSPPPSLRSLFSPSDPSLLPPPPLPPPATFSSSTPPPSASSTLSSSSSSALSTPSSTLSSPLTPRTRLCWRVPPPSPRRRPLPHQWMHPTTPTPTSPSPYSYSSSSSSLSTSLSVVDRASPTSPPISPSTHDPLTSLRLSAFMNESSLTSSPSSSSCSLFVSSTSSSCSPTLDLPQRIRQHPNPLPLQRPSLSAPCSPGSLFSPARPSQLVFASGAVGTASALGHVFGRPLQAKETIPCSPSNCTQWQKEPPHMSLAQQAQSPSHTFQQQCAVHKRFRLFRQRPRRCQVHASNYHHHGTTPRGNGSGSGPNYILPPTTVYPLVVRPDKILLDHLKEPPVQESWWPSALTSSISASSRLSFSTVSLSLSTTNTTTSTASYNTHGSEDDEGSSFVSNGGSYYSFSSSSKAAKKLAKKERQLQKQLQKQEQQRQQQQQQKLRCLCYLDTSLDNAQQQQQQQQPQKQHSSKVSSWHPQKKEKEKDKNKDKEAAGRLKRIWNESAIFSWSKPPGSSGSRQSSSSAASSHPTSSSGVGYHHHAIAGGESSLQANNSQVDVSNGSVSGGGVPMRHSMSGTDISDEGNHSLSDVEDDLDIIENLRHQHHQHHRHGTTNHTAAASSNSINNNNNNYSHHRVSFQGPYGTSSAKASAASSRPKDDLKAIARHQAEIGLQRQEPVEGEEDFSYGVMEDDDHHVLVSLTPAPPPPPPALSSFGNHITVNNDEADDDDDDEEDWDSRSDSGAPSSSLMYSADVREPSCRSTLALPMSTPANNRAYLKKPSNANLGGSVRGRQRCLSLPADTVGQPGGGGFLMSSKSSESWDEDFDIESADIHVPTKVVENQMSLQMDLYNIKDFASQIEDLKTLRASLRMASSSLKATNPKKHKDLSMLFQRDWEQAEVIIDLGEIAQTSGPTTTASSTTTSSSSGPASLQHTGKKPSEPSLASLSTSGGGGGLLSKQPSMRLHRPALSTSAPAHNNGLSALQSMQQQQQQVRSEFQSSILTGTMLAPGDTESDGATASGQSTRNSSRASSSLSASLKVNTEVAVEGTKMSQAPNSPPSVDTGRTTVGGVRMRQASSCMKESCSSPAGLGLCTSSMTPLRNGTITSTSTNSNDDYEDSDDGDLEIKYESGSIGLFRFPEGEQPLGGEGFKGGFHDKEDSSATVKPLRSSAGGSPRSPREGGFQAKMEASFRPHQKYSHHPKRRTHTGGMPNTRRLPNEDNYVHDEDDDGYESYGYGDGSSIGVFTPIPSDRHMQVLKDILMEGLGTEVARQYMFKQGEQDHVRFSVEVIPGLLGHLKGLQQRLGVQLMELQQLTVIV